MAEYSLFKEHYSQCTLPDKGASANKSISIAQSNVEEIIGLLKSAVTREIHPNLFIEYRRIFTLLIRRYFEVIESRRNGLVYSLTDQTRALFELMLQAFCLIRSDNPLKIAIDAYNLSALSWYSKRGDLIRAGEIDSDQENKWTKNKDKIETIFKKYKGRRPKFFGDMTVSQVAEMAKLKRQYNLFYGLFSSLTHNEPFASEDQGLYIDGELAMNIIPRKVGVERISGFFSYANEIFLIASLSCLQSFLNVNRVDYNRIVARIRGDFDNCLWGPEIKYLESIGKAM